MRPCSSCLVAPQEPGGARGAPRNSCLCQWPPWIAPPASDSDSDSEIGTIRRPRSGSAGDASFAAIRRPRCSNPAQGKQKIMARDRSRGRSGARAPPDDVPYILRWASLCHCCFSNVDNQDDFVRPLGPDLPTVILVRDGRVPLHSIFAVRPAGSLHMCERGLCFVLGPGFGCCNLTLAVGQDRPVERRWAQEFCHLA